MGANCLPAVMEWLTLSFDTSPRGLSMLAVKTLITMCITTRAYLDGKTTDKVVSESVSTQPQGAPVSQGVTTSQISAPKP